jgi:hypothetical protein
VECNRAKASCHLESIVGVLLLGESDVLAYGRAHLELHVLLHLFAGTSAVGVDQGQVHDHEDDYHEDE